MNPDPSTLLLEAYLVHQDKTVDVVLRNGTCVRRYISGFIKGSELAEDPFIMKWHLVSPGDSATVGWDCSGSSVVEIIAHSEIKEITRLLPYFLLSCIAVLFFRMSNKPSPE